MFCYSNNGMSMRVVNSDYEAQAGEILFVDYATVDQLTTAFSGYATASNRQNIQQQIIALEATITPRRIREAILAIDNGWVLNVNSQIAILRSSLTTS